jgi:hypothetical protein
VGGRRLSLSLVFDLVRALSRSVSLSVSPSRIPALSVPLSLIPLSSEDMGRRVTTLAAGGVASLVVLACSLALVQYHTGRDYHKVSIPLIFYTFLSVYIYVYTSRARALSQALSNIHRMSRVSLELDDPRAVVYVFSRVYRS